ncbi:TonB-dependent receptor plug domain-containing protein [Acinetobacter variabilis]|uniref:TonB-dependent receptor plug domain-containing protein n=1 Tax=Acinetobacter variabilis TaxID=70346 RepID=UPI0026729AD8|nr:TonB-dependent receptor [Acinetobacter variabilis]WKT72769.1 TonB-dependent receptor [Acinetobacter variabilis]
MSIPFQPAALAGSITFALGFSSAVHAAEQKVAQAALDTIVVTATRSEEKIENVPARIAIIEPAVLEQSPIKALPDLLQTDPSINVVQSGGYGQQTSLFLRGTNSNQALVLRDGVRLNTATTGAASIPFLDTTDLKQIEILKGPASVLYGTDAIGGVVQFVTKTPEKTGAFVSGEMGENQTYKSLVGADLTEDGIYAQIRGQILETDGTPVFNMNDSRDYSYDQKGYSAKFGVEKERYAASLDYSQNSGNGQYSDWGVFSSQNFKNEIVNLKGQIHPTETTAIHARLSQFKDDLNQVTSNSFVHSTTQEAEIYGKWNFSPTQNVLLGLTQRNTDAKTQAIDEDINSTGYYIQHQYQNHGFSTQLGLRVEDNEKFGTHTVAQGGIRYQLLPNTSIYTNIGSAFKAPTLNDMYAFGGNDQLKPEESISYELGIDQKLPFNILVGASAFHTEVDHLINSTCISTCDGDWVNTFPVYQNQNIDEAKMTGGELTAQWKKDQFFINAGYTYVKTEDSKQNTELLRRPRQSLTLSTGLQNADYGLSAALVAKSKAKDFARDIPGYARVDLNAYWNINPTVKIFTNIENVGDVKYKTVHSAGDQFYVNGGRLASAGVTFKY